MVLTVLHMAVQIVQNGEARFAGVESEKRGQVESGKPENTFQTSQTSQYSQTNCADRVSPANAGRVSGVHKMGEIENYYAQRGSKSSECYADGCLPRLREGWQMSKMERT